MEWDRWEGRGCFFVSFFVSLNSVCTRLFWSILRASMRGLTSGVGDWREAISCLNVLDGGLKNRLEDKLGKRALS